MNRLWQDCSFGIRVLTRHWRLASVIVLTMAVAVGAATTVLSVVNPVLLEPLPFPDAGRLYKFEATDDKGQHPWISVATFTDWQRRLPGARLAGYTVFDFSVFGDEGPGRWR